MASQDQVLDPSLLKEIPWPRRGKDLPIVDLGSSRLALPGGKGVQVLLPEDIFLFIRERSIGSTTKAVAALSMNELSQLEDAGEMLIVEHGGAGGEAVVVDPSMILRVPRRPGIDRTLVAYATLTAAKAGILRSLEVDYPPDWLERLGLASGVPQRLAVFMLTVAAVSRLLKDRKTITRT
jgi:hypothetical protein